MTSTMLIIMWCAVGFILGYLAGSEVADVNVDYPKAIAYPAHVTNTLGPPCTIKGIVLHTPEETADGNFYTPAYFAQPNKSASTQYGASYLGFIYQCVPENVAAIANGVLGKPYPLWANPNQSLNRQTTNIEIEGRAATIHQTMPRGSGQWIAVVEWCAWECRTHGFGPERIIGHRDVANNRSDPGSIIVPQIRQDVATELVGGPPAEEEHVGLDADQNNKLNEVWAKTKELWEAQPRVPLVVEIEEIKKRLDELEAASGGTHKVTVSHE